MFLQKHYIYHSAFKKHLVSDRGQQKMKQLFSTFLTPLQATASQKIPLQVTAYQKMLMCCFVNRRPSALNRFLITYWLAFANLNNLANLMTANWK